MHFAPYKFFGVRGFALAWLSDRVAEFDHYRLLGKPKNDWEIGSPATAQFAAVQQVSHRADGHVGVGVNGLDERFQLDSLEAVDHDIEYCFRGV